VMKSLSKQPGERQKSIELLARELMAAIKTQRELEVPIPKPDVIKPRSEPKQETEFLRLEETVVLSPEGERKNIASKSARPKYLWTLPVVLLTGLLTLLLYFKPWQRNPDNLTQSQPVPGLTSSRPDPVPSLQIGFSTMNVSLTRQGKQGNEEAVSPATTFYSGESVRVSIQTEQNGFMYIILQGSSAKVSMLYPNPRLNGGNNRITKGQPLNIPFKFDDQPGTETVYLVFVENKAERLISGLENATAQGMTALLPELSGRAVDIATIGGILKGQGTLVGLLKLRHQP